MQKIAHKKRSLYKLKDYKYPFKVNPSPLATLALSNLSAITCCFFCWLLWLGDFFEQEGQDQEANAIDVVTRQNWERVCLTGPLPSFARNENRFQQRDLTLSFKAKCALNVKSPNHSDKLPERSKSVKRVTNLYCEDSKNKSGFNNQSLKRSLIELSRRAGKQKPDKVNNANSLFIFLINLLIGQGCGSLG